MSICRTVLNLAVLTLLHSQVEAQGVIARIGSSDDPAGALAAAILAAGCRVSDVAGQLDVNQANLYIIDVSGTALKLAAQNPAEGDIVEIAVLGPAMSLNQVSVVRVSPTRDPDVIRYIGIPGRSAAMLEESAVREDLGGCAHRSYDLADFSAPEGKVEIRIAAGVAPPRKVGEFAFGIRRSYRGVLSFGPIASTLVSRSYSKLAAAGQDTTLAVGGGDIDVHYAFLFTYYLGGEQTRQGGSNWGPMIGLDVTDPTRNAFVGLTGDFGGGTLLVHLGAHLGQVARLINNDLDDGSIVSNVDVRTEDIWRGGIAFGASLDAVAAGEAFGKILKNVFGT